MAETYGALSKLSDEELKKKHDSIAGSTVAGLNFYREEIARREADAQNKAMVIFSKHMRDMTIAIAVMTLIMLVLTAANLYVVWPK